MSNKRENEEDKSNPDSQIIGLPFKLKELRTNLGLTIEQVALTTKISMPFILAFENGEVEKFPDEVFSRGFIRNLAKMYNADQKNLIDLYEDLLEEKRLIQRDIPDVGNKKKLPPVDYSTKRNKTLKPFRYPHNLTPFLIVGLIAGVSITYMYDDIKRLITTTNSKKDYPTRAETKKIAPSQEQKLTIINSEITRPSKKPSKKGKEASRSDIQVLIVKTLGSAQFKVSIEGKDWKSHQLNQGTHHFEFKKSLDLITRDAGSIEANYNGESLGIIGKSGELRRISFKTKDNSGQQSHN